MRRRAGKPSTMGAGLSRRPRLIAAQAHLAPGAPLGDVAPPVGAVGVPLGSTELGFRGLSPARLRSRAGFGRCRHRRLSRAWVCGPIAGAIVRRRWDRHERQDSCAASAITPPAGSSFTAAGTGAPPSWRHGHSPRLRRNGAGRVQPAAAVVSIAPSSVPSVTGSTPPCTGGTHDPWMDDAMGRCPWPAGSC